MKGREDPMGDVTPSPQPSPVKGEGERVTINLYFGVLLFLLILRMIFGRSTYGADNDEEHENISGR